MRKNRNKYEILILLHNFSLHIKRGSDKKGKKTVRIIMSKSLANRYTRKRENEEVKES